MGYRPAFGATAALLLACAMSGCVSFGDSDELHYVGDAELQHYIDRATDSRLSPVLDEDPHNESLITLPPRQIRHPNEDELRDMRLAEALRLAIANNKIIRDRGQFLSPQNQLLTAPNQANNSVFDVAIQATGVQFGQRGLNAALADFDANIINTMLWGRNETVQNNAFLSGGISPGDTLSEETAAWNVRLEKQMADGGMFTVSHNWNYTLNNSAARLFGSSYAGTLQFDYRRPLWAGSGTEFTRIVGAVGRNLQNVPTVFQGVVLARINNDISISDFEANVRNMLKDVEDIYWDLVLTYRTYHSEVVARDTALDMWRKAFANVNAGRKGKADEALSRDNYYEARARAENALADLFTMETQLRRLLGLPVNDGKVLRPIDEPVTAEFLPDWDMALTEALTRRVELRRQKWRIKSFELQKKAAESLTNPRFDFISGYRVNGFGDRLLGKNDTDGVTRHGLRSGYGTMTQGDQTGWNLGFEAWIPLGFRLARTQVRNFEFRLLKARTALRAQEHEISHELAVAFQNMSRSYQTAQTNLQRRIAAHDRVRVYKAALELKPELLDLLLRSQISLAQADIAYHRSIVEYNKAINELHYRKGTLLENNMISLAEGLWSPEAYDNALRRAWARSHGIENQQLRTEPEEFETRDSGAMFLPNDGVLRSHDGTGVPPSPAELPQELAPQHQNLPTPSATPSATPPVTPPVTQTESGPFGRSTIDLTEAAATMKVSDVPMSDTRNSQPAAQTDRRFMDREIKRYPLRSER